MKFLYSVVIIFNTKIVSFYKVLVNFERRFYLFRLFERILNVELKLWLSK